MFSKVQLTYECYRLDYDNEFQIYNKFLSWKLMK